MADNKNRNIVILALLVIFVISQEETILGSVINLDDDKITLVLEATGAQAIFRPQRLSGEDVVFGMDSDVQELTADLSITITGATNTNADTGGSVNINIVGETGSANIDSLSIRCDRCGHEKSVSIAYNLKLQFFPNNDLVRVFHNDVFFKDLIFIDDTFDIVASGEAHVDGNRGTGIVTVNLLNIQRSSLGIPEEDFLALKTQLSELELEFITLELTLEQRALEIKNLNLSLEQQAILVQAMQLTVQQKAVVISELTDQANEQARIISALELTLEEQSTIIASLTSEANTQAEIINELSLNIGEKAVLVDRLTVTNEEQAELINAMRLSFSDQIEIIDALDLTVQEDKVLISNLELSITEQTDLVSQLDLSNDEKIELISDLEEVVERQKSTITFLEEQITTQVEADKEEFDFSNILLIAGLLIAGLVGVSLFKK